MPISDYSPIRDENANIVPGNIRSRHPEEQQIINSIRQIMADLVDPFGVATPWVRYTPTFTGFGVPTSVNIFSKRFVDTLHIRGYFTSGTSTAVEARMSLGFNGTDGGITSDAAKVPGLQLAGPMVSSLATATAFYTLIESNVGYITFAFANATLGGLAKRNGNAVAASGQTLSFTAEIPISGW